MIVIKKRVLGILFTTHRFENKNLELVVSTGGSLTVRYKNQKGASVIALSDGEWSVATDDSEDENL